MLQSFKELFNLSKQKPMWNEQHPQSGQGSFITSQGVVKKQEEQPNGLDSGVDLRYGNIEELPSLEKLGLKTNEIEKGEITVLYDEKFIEWKLSTGYHPIKLVVTNYKICLFIPKSSSVYFPLSTIDKLEKYIDKNSSLKLAITLKDGRYFKFLFSSQAVWKKNYQRIDMFCFVKCKRHFFSYRHYEYNKAIQEEYKGWKLYNPIAEFERMGIRLMEHTEEQIVNYISDFKILENKNGKICATYPEILVVPSRMPYDSLIRCSKFRSKQRMPAMSYAYQYAADKFSVVYRSSQSKVGIQNNRSSDDQLMLRLIGNHKIDPKSNEGNEVDCKIYDARGFYSAFGNKISGKGYQSDEYYPNCKLQFLSIPNIHAVRQAYIKALNACSSQDKKFHINLQQSKWYQYIFLILYWALDVAKSLSNGINCLVHCSDGWDRTSQLCSLSELILDPYYRTIKGFMVLIEKDWMYFGHQFVKRLGQGINNPMSQQKSQIFLQFLDSVTQIMYQFPLSFQFNFKFIHFIAEQAYANLYGNFICNSYQEMIKYGVKENTVSLWSKMLKHKDNFINPFYDDVEKTLLNFDANEKNMRFWREHFLQNDGMFNDVYNIYQCKFTEDNLYIIHRNLGQEKMLLKEKYKENLNVIANLDQEMKKMEMKLRGQFQFAINENPKKMEKRVQKKVKSAILQTQQCNNFQKRKTVGLGKRRIKES